MTNLNRNRVEFYKMKFRIWMVVKVDNHVDVLSITELSAQKMVNFVMYILSQFK